MTRQAYTSAVLSHVRRLTAREREAVRAEIDGHIEDHLESLLDLGYDWDLASQRTLNAMGDPEEVGRELDKQYPLRWLILSRIALGLLVTVCLLVLLSRPGLYGARANLRARWFPQSFTYMEEAEEQGATVLKTDIRIPVGSDIWYIYASGTKVSENGEAEAAVFLCYYDKDPFQSACGIQNRYQVTDCRGELCENTGSGSWGWHTIAGSQPRALVRRGDPCVTISIRRFGQVYEAQVPLEWEEAA